MRNNPEFARNLWLEFTPHRLVAVPVIILGLAFLGGMVLDDGYGKTLGLFAAFGSAITLGLWGTRLAAGSIADEAANRTWDGQRLSGLTPWEMTWGKLAGSTAVAWYGGVLFLAVFVSASAGVSPPRRLAIAAASLVAGALLCQGVALLAALVELRRGRAFFNRSRGAGGMIFALVLWSAGASVVGRTTATTLTTSWFGMPLPTAEFFLVSLALFAAWAVTGAWRLMREELQVQAPPLAWGAFVAFFMAFSAGLWVGSSQQPAPFLDAGAGQVTMRLVVAYLSGSALLYLAAIFEAKDPVAFRRLIARWRSGGAAAVIAALPCWLATVPALLVVGAAAALTAVLAGPAAAGALGNPALFVISCFGFMVRDIALLLTFNFSRNPKRADVAAFFYWVLLYGVAPTIFRKLDIRDTLYLFYPTGVGVASVFAPAIQAAAVLFLLRIRWRRMVSGKPAEASAGG